MKAIREMSAATHKTPARAADLKRERMVVRIGKLLRGVEARSGKVFYSSPASLFQGRHILIGYNPGGAEEHHQEEADRIWASVTDWPKIRKNHYWNQRWNWEKDTHNPLQRRIHGLVESLGRRPGDFFTSNLWFFRSRTAADLRRDDAGSAACVRVWREFLAVCPARRIICIGVRTAEEFLAVMEADQLACDRLSTSHSGAEARLITAMIGGKTYRIAALPHLSRFAVHDDGKLIRAVKRHFRKK